MKNPTKIPIPNGCWMWRFRHDGITIDMMPDPFEIQEQLKLNNPDYECFRPR